MAYTSNPIRTRSIDNYLGDRTVFEGSTAIVNNNVVTITKIHGNHLVDVTTQSGELLQGYAPNTVLPIVR